MANLTIVSFGFKYGVPDSVSYVVDTRIIRNPQHNPTLSILNGFDAQVRDWVLGHNLSGRIVGMALEAIMYRFIDEGKNSFALGIGCAGGRHRSVVIAEKVASEARGWAMKVDMVVLHRDLWRPAIFDTNS